MTGLPSDPQPVKVHKVFLMLSACVSSAASWDLAEVRPEAALITSASMARPWACMVCCMFLAVSAISTPLAATSRFSIICS